jgi:hypothetical protein
VLTTPAPPAPAFVSVAGLSSAELRSLAAAGFDRAQWEKVLAVRVEGAGADAPAMTGRYTAAGEALTFTPAFPLDAGRRYVATLDPRALIPARAEAVITTVVALPASTHGSTTIVTRVWPSADLLPENLLRMYLEFSAPMAREHGRDFLTLVDERGAEVKDAFLALDVDFWSPDGRRYTVFLDPGRVKRGILPNDQFGRALAPGHRYTLVVNPKWRDGNGQPLAAAFSHTFGVGPADMAPLTTSTWKVTPPAANTRDPLTATFPKPLDHGLLHRALGVALRNSITPLDGLIEIGAGETTWRFIPTTPWKVGDYDLVVLSILEDPMGNKLGRPFDVDRFTEIDKTPAPERTTIGFTIK